MRLLHGLLSVEDCSVIGSERPMSGGRSDLVVYSLEGSALLVVEYKQRHSGAASTHQQQDTMQVRRSRCGELGRPPGHYAGAPGVGVKAAFPFSSD